MWLLLVTRLNSLCKPHIANRLTGAGSGGASAAYYINQFKHPCDRVNITVYERSDYVGGRSTTVNAYNDPTEPVELGASIFVEVNRNLVSAARKFGLTTEGLSSSEVLYLPKTLGVYDGQQWVFRGSENGWWTTLKILWKYGMAPIRTQRLMKQTTEKFFKMYDELVFPFKDLSQTAYNLGLTDITSSTGEQFLEQNGIVPPFSTDIIQASTRVNYAQNINKIHGLETMVCMATDGAMAVRGGNWQIFDNMLRASGATVRLSTSVSSINRLPNGTYAVDASSPSTTIDPTSHDTIILAAPLQYSNLTLTPKPLNPPPEIPYVRLHVTLFTSPYALDPQYFNLAWMDQVPTTILTTKPSSPDHPLVFFSISTLRLLHNPRTGQQEYLYKIFSPEPLEQWWLKRILMANTDDAITWKYEKVWHSYPYLEPRVTFEDIQLDAEGKVWYTSGIESFISTMETSSLMGMNVARLVVDGWNKESREKDEEQTVLNRPERDMIAIEEL